MAEETDKLVREANEVLSSNEYSSAYIREYPNRDGDAENIAVTEFPLWKGDVRIVERDGMEEDAFVLTLANPELFRDVYYLCWFPNRKPTEILDDRNQTLIYLEDWGYVALIKEDRPRLL